MDLSACLSTPSQPWRTRTCTDPPASGHGASLRTGKLSGMFPRINVRLLCAMDSILSTRHTRFRCCCRQLSSAIKPHTFLNFAMSLWSQGLLPCKERIYYGRHYVIKTQRKPRNDPTELVVFRPSAVILRAGVSNIVTTSSQSE